jgi:hypothetical protein
MAIAACGSNQEDRSLNMEPITDKERLTSQLRAAHTLVALLNLARNEGLPPISWSLAAGCHLIGKCPDTSALGAWRDAIGAEDIHIPLIHDRIRAHVERYGGPLGADVTLFTNLPEPGDDAHES